MPHWTSFDEPLRDYFLDNDEQKAANAALRPSWDLVRLGYAYGENAKRVFDDRAIEDIIRRSGQKPDRELVAYWYEYGDEPGDGRSGQRPITIRQMAETIIEWRYHKQFKINDLATLIRAYTEAYGHDYGGISQVLTKKAAKAFDLGKWRERIEPEAKAVASKYNVGINSIDFIRAVTKELKRCRRDRDDWNNPERRMEEWAAHMYCGSRDAYWDDLNYENGKIESREDTLRDILKWVAEACPLVWLQWEQSRLTRRAK